MRIAALPWDIFILCAVFVFMGVASLSWRYALYINHLTRQAYKALGEPSGYEPMTRESELGFKSSIYWGVTLSCLVSLQLYFLPEQYALFLAWIVIIPMVIIDRTSHQLPIGLSILFMWLGMAIAVYGEIHAPTVKSAVLGIASGTVMLLVPNLVYRVIARTEESPIGGGDIYAAGAIGAWVGFESVIYIVCAAVVLMALHGLVMKQGNSPQADTENKDDDAQAGQSSTHIPMMPCLAAMFYFYYWTVIYFQ